jgi:acetate kinase
MILVLNCGSQSIKWKLFEDNLKLKKKGERDVFNSQNYRKVLTKEFEKISNYKKEIKIIGHRVVHGGNKFRKPTLINKRSLKELEKFNKFAPLHNPFNILGIKISQKIFPDSKQIAVFDTDFYLNLSEKAFDYTLPKYIIKKFGFKRLGFHGVSHEFVAKEAARKVKRPFKKLKIITCHLGGGSSITAIKNGRAIDTSMGFTPMEGVIMMTRPGDIDAGIVLELTKNFSLKKTDEILNLESGLKSISGSKGMLEILRKAKKGNKRAKFALEIFAYKIKKYIGAYFAILGGCDLLVFTGTIGYGSLKIRKMICKDLTILKNTKILAIETNEELAIAKKIIKVAK